MNLVLVGCMLVIAAVGLFAQALFADPVPRVPKSRRLGTVVKTEPLWRVIYRTCRRSASTRRSRVAGGCRSARASWRWPTSRSRSALWSPGWSADRLRAFLVGTVMGRSLLIGALLAILVPSGAKLTFEVPRRPQTKGVCQAARQHASDHRLGTARRPEPADRAALGRRRRRVTDVGGDHPDHQREPVGPRPGRGHE